MKTVMVKSLCLWVALVLLGATPDAGCARRARTRKTGSSEKGLAPAPSPPRVESRADRKHKASRSSLHKVAEIESSILATASLGSLQAVVQAAIQMYVKAGGQPTAEGPATRMLLGIVTDKRLAASVDVSRPAAAAIVAQYFDGNLFQFMAAVPVSDDGTKLVEYLKTLASKKRSTPWGGYSMKMGSETIWVNPSGKHLLLASRPEYIPFCRTLLRPVLERARPGTTMLNLKLSRFFAMMKELEGNLVKMIPGPASFRVEAKKLVLLITNYLSSVSEMSMELGLSLSRGLLFKLAASGLTGGMALWLSALRPPDLRFHEILPRGTYSVGGERTPRIEKIFYETLVETVSSTVREYLLWRLNHRAALRHARALDRAKKAFIERSKAFGGHNLQASFVDPVKGIHWIAIYDLVDEALARRSLKELVSYGSTDLKLLLRALLNTPRTKPSVGRRKRRRKRLELKYTMKLVRTRLAGKPVDLIRLDLSSKKKRRRKPDIESLFDSDRFELAIAYLGSKAIVCVGDNWRAHLTSVIRKVSGMKRGVSPKGPWKELQSLLTPGVAAASISSPMMLFRDWIAMQKSRVFKLVAALNGNQRLSREERRLQAKISRQLESGLDKMLKRWPAGGGYYTLSGRKGKDYFMQMRLDTKECVALIKAGMMALALTKQVVKALVTNAGVNTPTR